MHEVGVKALDVEFEVLAREVIRRFFFELLDEWREGSVCRRLADAGLEANADIVSADRIGRDFQGKIDVAIIPGEAWRSDADYGVVFADDLDGLSDDRWIAVVMALPEFVTEHGYGLRVLAVDGVGRDDAAPEIGWDTEEIEGVRGDIVALDVFRQVVTGYGEVPLVADESIFDDGRFADGLPLRSGEAETVLLPAGEGGAQVHHAIRIRVRVWVYEDGIDDAEDRCGGSDAEGPGDDGG